MRNGIELIKKYEGLRLKAYLCPAGIPTIGYGETKGVHLGMQITAEEAEIMLENRYEEFEHAVLELVNINLTDNELGALVSFAYNVGIGNLAKSTLLRKLNANCDRQEIAKEFLKWDRAGGKKLPGLTKRRQEESDLFLTY